MKLATRCAGLGLALLAYGCANEAPKTNSSFQLTQVFDTLTTSRSGGMTQNFVDLQIRSDGSAIEVNFDPRFGYKVRAGRLSRAAVAMLEPQVQEMLKAYEGKNTSPNCPTALPDAAISLLKVIKDSKEHIWQRTTCKAEADRWNALNNTIWKVTEPTLKSVP